MIRSYIWPGTIGGEFDTISEAHQVQLQSIYQGWLSGRDNENIAEQAVRGNEPPGDLATGEVSEEALGQFVRGLPGDQKP